MFSSRVCGCRAHTQNIFPVPCVRVPSTHTKHFPIPCVCRCRVHTPKHVLVLRVQVPGTRCRWHTNIFSHSVCLGTGDTPTCSLSVAARCRVHSDMFSTRSGRTTACSRSERAHDSGFSSRVRGYTTTFSRPVCAGTQQPFLAPCAQVPGNRRRVHKKPCSRSVHTHTHTTFFSFRVSTHPKLVLVPCEHTLKTCSRSV
nr:MAG: hypothetical protein [Molluscum contagiosum virus]